MFLILGHTKDFYANSLNYQVCAFTALGCWLSLIRDYFGKKDVIFIRAGEQASGSKSYATQLKEMLSGYHKEIMSFGALVLKTKPHGFCKGSGTDATSGTTELLLCHLLPCVENGVKELYLIYIYSLRQQVRTNNDDCYVVKCSIYINTNLLMLPS